MLPNLLMFVSAAGVLLLSGSGAENVGGRWVYNETPATFMGLHHASNQTNKSTGWEAQLFCLLTNLPSPCL